MKSITALLLVTATLAAFVAGAEEVPMAKPTVVLVHGAFAEVVQLESRHGEAFKEGLSGGGGGQPLAGREGAMPVIWQACSTQFTAPSYWVGHSYGGTVITVAATGRANVKALIYVSGLAPDLGRNGLRSGR